MFYYDYNFKMLLLFSQAQVFPGNNRIPGKPGDIQLWNRSWSIQQL
jgi:hypothetical protein